MARWLPFVLLTAAAIAQNLEIRGRVLLGGAGMPDVQVTLTGIDVANRTSRTDSNGAFRFALDRPGQYSVFPTKEGYFVSGFDPGTPRAFSGFLAVDAGRPVAEITINMVRGGEVSGRVLDEVTREPLADMDVELLTRRWDFGQISLQRAMQGQTKTDRDGRFRFTDQAPGDYLVSVSGPENSGARVVRTFSKEDLEKTDEAYATTYWPGGGAAAAALPIQLGGGGYADLGTIYARKATQYRAHVSLENTCPDEGNIGQSALSRNDGPPLRLGILPCGEIMLYGLRPGSYAIAASSSNSDTSGAATFEIAAKNADVHLNLRPHIQVQGMVTLADGAAELRQGLLPRMGLRPIDPRLPVLPISMRWEPDQRHFRIAIPVEGYNLLVAGTGYYVKEIRYNGAPYPGSTVALNLGAASQNLEILVDDKFGTIGGTVLDGNRPASATVWIVEAAGRVEDIPFNRILGASGATGTFASLRVPPGEYRVIAFARELEQKVHEPGVLQRMLSTAQKVTVGPNGVQNIQVRLSDPR